MGYSHGTRLAKMGLTNADQEDFGNVQMATTRAELHRYCDSYRCMFKATKGQVLAYGRIRKYTTSDDCPDCGSALFMEWVRTLED